MSTIAQLFPKSKFPLRAITEVKCPEKKAEIRLRIYYQTPAINFRQQKSGAVASFLHNGKEIFSMAIAASRSSSNEVLYLGKLNGAYRRFANLDKLKEKAEAICKKAGLLKWLEDAPSTGLLPDLDDLDKESWAWKQF